MTKDVDGNGEDHSQEMGIRDWEREESEKKRPSFDDLESTEKKKKKRVKDLADEEMPMLPERRTAKERREHLAHFVLDLRDCCEKLEMLHLDQHPLFKNPYHQFWKRSEEESLRFQKIVTFDRTCFVVDDHDDNSSNYMVELGFENVANEGGNDGAVEVESEEAISNHGISDTLTSDEIQNVVNVSSHENLSPKIAVDEEPKQVFRARINDTQDLFSDSQTSNSKDELAEEAPNNPLEEVLALSLFALNLKLDSAPLDDISSDEEDNDKENIDPYLHESVDLSPTPNGDPVKPFVDEEAEEEDDSDNDLLRFQDDGNEEDEDSEDLEELRDVIATGYEEKRSDIERRMELHQKLLDQQDAAKTEQLSWKWGPKHRETALLDEEGLEEDDEDEEDFLETTEDLPLVNLRMHIKKIKEMIPQMFTDKDDMYISSDDEEAEKKLVEQCLSEKANQQAELLPPTEDARSKELYGYIKKVNNMPDTRRKSKTSSFSNMLFMGKKGNVSSKSSFIGRGSNCSIPSSRKHGSCILRSFVFEREDSNTKSTITVAENSSDVIQRQNRPTKTASAKFNSNSQIKPSSKPRKDETETSSGAQLLEILRRSSLQTSHCIGNSIVDHTESIFAAFKLEKKSIGNKANISIKTF